MLEGSGSLETRTEQKTRRAGKEKSKVEAYEAGMTREGGETGMWRGKKEEKQK